MRIILAGDWSDRSPLWTYTLKREIGQSVEDDGLVMRLSSAIYGFRHLLDVSLRLFAILP
jgi:hypothetical protein